jgi:type II secretory pathway pseudopilin PulG
MTLVGLRPRQHAQRGFALLALVAIVIFGIGWALLSAFGVGGRAAAERARNAEALAQAKQALIAWAAVKALDANEDNPGRLPCPEAAGYVGDPKQEGIAAAVCAQPKVGRLPWRTLGLPKLVDASGEPLWYVTSPDWALPSSSANLRINSDSVGKLTLDGPANTAVALVIAPGAALNVPAVAGCAARSQTRGRIPPDYRDYLECDNASFPADTSFVSAGPVGASDSLNDQVVAITAAEILPGIEAAIAARMQRDLAPLLAQAASEMPGASVAAPLYPFAADWAVNLTREVVVYGGSSGVTQGLMPLAIRSRKACEPDRYKRPTKLPYCTTAEERTLASMPCIQGGGGDEHCDLGSAVSWAVGTRGYSSSSEDEDSRWVIRWADGSRLDLTIAPDYIGPGRISGVNCRWSSASRISCRIEYGRDCEKSLSCNLGAIPVDLFASTGKNTGLVFRRVNQTLLDSKTFRSSDITMDSDGGARVVTHWLLPGMSSCSHTRCIDSVIEIPSLFIEDNVPLQARLHDELPGNDNLHWVFANGWDKLTYFAASPARVPGGTAKKCDAANQTDCLSIVGIDSKKPVSQQALLILAGRALVPRRTSPPCVPDYCGTAPPCYQDYFEGLNADRGCNPAAPKISFERKTVNAFFSDRVVLIEPRL